MFDRLATGRFRLSQSKRVGREHCYRIENRIETSLGLSKKGVISNMIYFFKYKQGACVFVSAIVGMEFHCRYGCIDRCCTKSDTLPWSTTGISKCLNMMPVLNWEDVRTHINAS